MTPRQATAVHESAHLVMARVGRIRVLSAWIGYDHGQVFLDPTGADPLADLRMTMAGAAAQFSLAGEPSVHVERCASSDRDTAWRLACRVSPDPVGLLERERWTVSRLVREHQDAIDGVAAMLLRVPGGRLAGDDLARAMLLVDNNPPRRLIFAGTSR